MYDVSNFEIINQLMFMTCSIGTDQHGGFSTNAMPFHLESVGYSCRYAPLVDDGFCFQASVLL